MITTSPSVIFIPISPDPVSLLKMIAATVSPAALKKSRKAVKQDVLTIPTRGGGRVSCISADRGPVLLQNDREFAVSMANATDNDPTGGTVVFYRIALASETLRHREYVMSCPPPYVMTIQSVAGLQFLFRTYTRTDKLTTLENFDEMMYFYKNYAPEYLQRDVQYILDWMSMAPLIYHDQRSRGLKRAALTVRCTPMWRSHRKAVIRELRNSTPVWPWLLAGELSSVRTSMEKRLLAVWNRVKKDEGQVAAEIKAFKQKNDNWCAARLRMRDEPIQMPCERWHADNLLKSPTHPFFQLRSHDILNECNQLPPAMAHTHYMCEAVKNSNIAVNSGEQLVVILPDQQQRVVRVKPSTYKYRTNALTVLEKVEGGDEYSVALPNPLKRAPSMGSISGFSSNSRASTATVSPGDWHYNWKMQTRHRDMEHRLMANGVPDEADIARKAQVEHCNRTVKEIENRVKGAELITKIANVYSKTASIPFAAFLEGEKGGLLRDRKVLAGAIKKMREVSDAAKTVDGTYLQAMELQFRRLSQCFPVDSEDPYMGCDLSSGWTSAIDSGMLASQTLSKLISSHDSWVEESALSERSLVPRADKQLLPRDTPKPTRVDAVILASFLNLLLILGYFAFF